MMITTRERGKSAETKGETVRIEVCAILVTKLLLQGHLRVADLHCLDCESMHCLRRLCLQNCVWREEGCEKRIWCPHKKEEFS